MFFEEKIKTKYGTFSYVCKHKMDRKNINIVFFTAMGINSSYFDFYGIGNGFPDSINCIFVDLLGSGRSSTPKNEERSLDNISNEINLFLELMKLDRYYVCCHSFSAIYLLNVINNNPISDRMRGFIGIDPTSPKVMKNYKEDFLLNLEEAQKSKKDKKDGKTIIPDSDVNPLLPENLYKQCERLYRNLSGSNSEITELKFASQTVDLTKNLLMPNLIPTLSFISSLNSGDYNVFGNPYFNNNKKSMEIKLNGHHFLHWIHNEIISKTILNYIIDIEDDWAQTSSSI